MGVRQLVRPFKPQKKYLDLFLANEDSANKDTAVNADVKNLEREEDTQQLTISPDSFVVDQDLIEIGEKVLTSKVSFKTQDMKKTKKKSAEPKMQTYGRGRPRKKSFGKKCGNSNDKQSQDGIDNGEGRSNRARQQRGGGNGSNGGRRKKDDDDRDDENDEIDDEFDENNEDDDEEEEEQTEVEYTADDPEMTPEQEAEMAQELLCLIPPKHLNCDPAEKPAKPGTAVDLHGVVLHETTGGLVVLNIRWRNKIYSGALIDVRKSKWASERIKPDPFPESVNPKPVDSLNVGGKKKSKKPKSPEPADKETKKTADAPMEQTFKEPIGVPVAFKRLQDSSSSDSSDSGARKKARLSPPLIECPEPNCGKRYSHKNGLKYHQAHAHQKKDDQEEQKLAVQVSVPKSGNVETDAAKNPASTENRQIISISNLVELKDKQIDGVSGVESSSKCNVLNTTAMPVSTNGADIDSQKTLLLPQVVPQAVPNVLQQSVPQIVPQMVPQIVVKTEEESAVESIKDVNFEVTVKEEKSAQEDKDVPKIILEPSTDAEQSALFSVGSSMGLAPFTSRSSLSFAQFSPTLASLNPQMLNNSLSNALQTAVKKEDEKETEEKGEGDDKTPSEESHKSKLELNVQPSGVGLKAGMDVSHGHFAMNRDLRNEDIIPSSPDDFMPSGDALPDSLGIHLYQKNAKLGPIDRRTTQPPQTWNSETSTFSPSLFSVSLYNQIRQEQASRQFPGADSVTGDLAEPCDIQRAISQVDVRRHFSPMLLNYLNTGARGKENSASEVEQQVADAVSTSEKTEDSAKSIRKNDIKDAATNLVSTSFSQLSPRPDSIKRERFGDNRSNLATMLLKPDFLQPNISAGRPISRPITKPDSITGGAKMTRDLQRFSGQATTADGRNEEASQSSMFIANTHENTSSPSTGKQGSYIQPSTSGFSGDAFNTVDRSGTAKNPSPSSYLDKTLIEAKTWIPQEVYRQPSKSISGQERPTVNEKQSAPVRMGVDVGKKTGSPYEYRTGLTNQPDEAKKIEHGTSAKKTKPAALQQYASFVGQVSNSDSEKIKLHDTTPSEKEISMEISDTSRYTLSSDRSVQSPAENRGRPRKIRVEKTQQIPIGSSKDIESSRGTPEHNPRKQPVTTCTYTRTSVIHSMTTPPEDSRMGVSVKEEYVSPEGKRKSSPRLDRAFEKKIKQDFKKSEASRIFEAEREKLKNRHVESHYAMEVRNMHLRVNELPTGAKNELTMRRSVSPGLSRMQTLAAVNAEKAERHAREKMEAKGIPMSPAFGQSSPYHSHSSSDIDKLRSEYLQHDLSRMSVPFGGSLLPSAEGYPGLPSSFPSGSYFAHRSGPSQADSFAQHRFELMSSHMDQEKAYSKYSAEKNELSLKLGPESSKMPPQDRMRGLGREGHSNRPPYYPQASPLGFPSREAVNPTRSPKSSPFGFRPNEMFSASRSQRAESDAMPKDSKAGDGRRDMRRDYGMAYSSPFFQPPFQYSNMSSNVPGKSYPQRMSEQRSPYKHSADGDKGRYQGHPSNQPQTGPGGMLSANLVLTKADGLGFGSMPYDNRNQDGKK